MPAPRIFLSHSHRDQPFTDRLVHDLRASGIDVWVDTSKIKPADFVKQINEGLANRDWVILVQTPNALRSEWVQMEINAAIALLTKRLIRGIIPVLAERCDPREVPPLWATLQHVDACDDYSAALFTLLRHMGLTWHEDHPQGGAGDTALSTATEANALPKTLSLLSMLDNRLASPDGCDIQDIWSDNLPRTSTSETNPNSINVPVGVDISGNVVSVDFMTDGPHGVIAGETGSGKSQLLYSIVLSLAIKYSPETVGFVFLDHGGKSGLASFGSLPHTRGVLSSTQDPGKVTRFLKLLEAELTSRRKLREEGGSVPYLIVVVDDSMDILAPSPGADEVIILDTLLKIARLGRELNVSLLFTAQRAASAAMQRLLGYVQFRICLRTGTPEDSREVIGRNDAAFLPTGCPGCGFVSKPGRGIQLFQSATALKTPDDGRSSSARFDTGIQRVLHQLESIDQRSDSMRWPSPLPSPTERNPTPLVLFHESSDRKVEDAWNLRDRRPLGFMEIPLGLYDRPQQLQRDWLVVDLHGHSGALQAGPLLVVGDLNSGKSTTLQTLVVHAATTWQSDTVKWYIANPSRSLTLAYKLRQSYDLLEPESNNVISGLEEDETLAWIQRLDRAVHADRTSGGPAILVVVDDYDLLAARSIRVKSALHQITQEVMRSRKSRVYLAMSVERPSFDGLPSQIMSGMATRIVLYMRDRDQMVSILGTTPRRLPGSPAAIPGRGFAQTSSGIDMVQIAAPVYGESEAFRNQAILQTLRLL